MDNKEAIKELQRVDDFVNGVGRPEVLGTPEILSSALELAIKALEESEWVPVSERLPDKSDWYLATMVGEFGNTHTYSVFYSTTNKTFEFLEKVTAWKPLPEPYKENDK